MCVPFIHELLVTRFLIQRCRTKNHSGNESSANRIVYCHEKFESSPVCSYLILLVAVWSTEAAKPKTCLWKISFPKICLRNYFYHAVSLERSYWHTKGLLDCQVNSTGWGSNSERNQVRKLVSYSVNGSLVELMQLHGGKEKQLPESVPFEMFYYAPIISDLIFILALVLLDITYLNTTSVNNKHDNVAESFIDEKQ